MNNDRIEFYFAGKHLPFRIINSSITPAEGELIGIEKTTYEVIGRSFAIDTDLSPQGNMRCNLIVRPVK